jgi:TIR domain-containing protein
LPKPGQDVAIFESYGWGDAREIAQRLKDSLESVGYDVWIDREHLRPDDEHFWLALEQALNQCSLVVALLSPHSVRLQGERATPHGASICHYELMLAVRKEKAVLPIVVIDCDTPLAIIRYEPVHFTAWQTPAAYREGVDAILRAIQDIRAGDHRYVIYVDQLAPYDFFAELKTAAGSFVGREWVLSRIEDWLPSERRCFLIEAEPGSGKTALVAEMVRRNDGGRVLAYHFCNALKPDTVNARKFVRFIAAMLCGTVSAYAERLRRSEELVGALKSNDPMAMLSQGVLAALHAISMQATHYILVDALDEAVAGTDSGEPITIAQLLARTIGEFPPWLKLIATTRRDDRVLPLFQDADRCFIGGAVAAQQEDLRNYVEHRFAEPNLGMRLGSDEAAQRRAAAAIADRAAGNFQYADTVIGELRSGELHLDELDHLPKELSNLYYRFAEKRYPKPGDFRVARSVLGVLLSAREPLTRDRLQAITRLDRDDLMATLDTLSCFLTWDLGAGEDRVYRTAHKSISDWLIAPVGGFDRFKVDLAEGREAVLAYCRDAAGRHDRYALTHLVAHLLEKGDVATALREIRGGLFAARHDQVDPRFDLDDSQAVVARLVAAKDKDAIIALSRTDNVWQRDGVAAALSLAPAGADQFVDSVVDALLRVE